MYLGNIVEITDWQSLYENPLHPYTKALLSSVPIPAPFLEEERHHVEDQLKSDHHTDLHYHGNQEGYRQ